MTDRNPDILCALVDAASKVSNLTQDDFKAEEIDVKAAAQKFLLALWQEYTPARPTTRT